MGNMKEAEANVWLVTLEAATAVSSKDTERLLQVIKDVPLRLTFGKFSIKHFNITLMVNI